MDTTNTPIAELLSSVLSNPELLQKIHDAVGGTGTPSSAAKENAPSPNDAAANAVAPPSAPPIDGLASVLENAELMAKLPQVMALLSPMLEKTSSVQAAAPSATASKSSESHRNELLLALKPFLSPERQNAVDVMLRVAQLGQVLRHIK